MDDPKASEGGVDVQVAKEYIVAIIILRNVLVCAFKWLMFFKASLWITLQIIRLL